MTTTDPAIREAEARGARRQRESMRRYLRGEIADARAGVDPVAASAAACALTNALNWLLASEARYKRAAGGLKGRGGR